MLWGLVPGWLGVGWAAVGVCFFLLFALGVFVGPPSRPWRESLALVVRYLPLVLPLALAGWPLLFVGVVLAARRDLLLERARSATPYRGLPRPPGRRAWRAGRDPGRLLYGLGELAGRREHQLFACACCRRIWDRLPEGGRRAVEAAERQAEGLADPAELAGAREQAEAALSAAEGEERLEAVAAARACLDCLTPDGAAAAWRASLAAGRRRREWRAQQALLHEVVGDPFEPLPPRDFPAELAELARACRDGDEGLFPLLADALEELGEPAAAEHCRRPGHARGCHVLDWVLKLR
jgi:hypothetical protein